MESSDRQGNANTKQDENIVCIAAQRTIYTQSDSFTNTMTYSYGKQR